MLPHQIPTGAIDAHQDVSQDRLEEAQENTTLQADYYDEDYPAPSEADVVDEDELGTAPESESQSNATLGSRKEKTALWYGGFC